MKNDTALSPQEIEVLKEQSDKLPELPPQVKLHFPNISSAGELQLRLLYAGSKDRPNFMEWVESFIVSDLLGAILDGKDMLAKIKEAIDKHEAERDQVVTDDDQKAYDKKLQRLQKFHQSIADQKFAFTKELRVATQANLSREAPKKVEVTQIKVTPADVAKLMRDAKEETIDVKGERV